MELSVGENPQCYMDSAITYSGLIRKTDKLSNKHTLFEQCRNILQRPHENRIPSDNQTLLQLVEKSEMLRELVELYGIDFLKGILRNAKMEFVDEGQVIAEEEQDIKYMVIVLEGKLGVEKPTSDAFNEQLQGQVTSLQQQEALELMSLKTEALFERLTMLAKKEREVQRRAMKLKRKATIPISDYKFMLPVLSTHDYEAALSNIQRTVLLNEQFGGKERLNSKFFKNRLISVEKSILFIIEIAFLFYWLEVAFRTKLARNIEKLKCLPAFQSVINDLTQLDNDKLADIILSMKLVKKSKSSCVYSQGDPADTLYLLIEGQLKLSKQADLFRENPNNLYTDRRKLIPHQRKALSKSQDGNDLLPFANLTTLYNYRPIRKTIGMGLLSSFGLFGEEEVIFKTKRETTVQVSSIEASYYQIEFKKVLEIIGAKNIDKFKEELQASVSKKVLYRQKEFAEQVHLQNQNNLNYFYIDEGKSDASPRKIKLEKINQKVEPKTARETSTEGSPAFYTTFNFNKMLNKRYSTLDNKLTNNTTTNEQASSEKLPSTEQILIYNGAEEKVVDISHTWDPIERKVRQVGRLSKRLSPFKHSINIQEPLIDQQFFDNVAKEQRRINKELRNIRFSLGKRRV